MAAPAAAAAAAAGAVGAAAGPGGAPPARGPGSLIGLLFNVGLAMMMYMFVSSRKTAKPARNLTAALQPAPVGGGGDAFASALDDARAPAAAAAAPPAVAPPPTTAGNLFALMGVPDPSDFRKNVPPELARAEAARAEALAALPATARLYPLWRPGQRFSMFVYLSTSAEPVADWSEARGVDAEWRAGRATPFDAQRADAGVPASVGAAAAPAPAFSLFGGMMQRLLATSTGEPPAVVFRNATFDALAPEAGAAGDVAATADAADAAAPPPQPDPSGPRLLWAQRGLSLDWAPGVAREQRFDVALPAAVLRNESGLYAHVLFVAEGAPVAPAGTPGAVPGGAHVIVHPLVSLLKRKPVKATFNLLGGGDGGGGGGDASATATPRVMAFGIGAVTPKPTTAAASGGADDEEEEDDSGATAAGALAPSSDAADAPGAARGLRFLPYWRPTLHVQLVGDGSVYASRTALAPHLAATMALDAAAVPPGGYLPLAWVNDFWLLQSHLLALNASAPRTLPLTVSYSTASIMKWSLQATMASQWAAQEAMGTSSSGESDIIKTVLLETNPVLLAVTFAVSLLHMVFEFLAFRADVSFWRAAKSMEGVSVRSLFVNLFSQAVILLYLLDNDTSYMILGSSAIGLAIEVWKLRKAVAVKLVWPPAAAAPTGALSALLARLPRLDLQDRDERYSASKTAEYDDIAIRHMLLVAYPLLAGYATYSLLYERHRSWYSWVVTSLTGYIYAFGFVQMTPQIYINFRLKSVAHLPWRALVYKTLNTFVDDLFSFVIKMPVMHRIACLRDDVIFIVLIGQRWAYPIDPTRRNEFGTSAADVAAAEARARGEKRVAGRGKLQRRNGDGVAL